MTYGNIPNYDTTLRDASSYQYGPNNAWMWVFTRRPGRRAPASSGRRNQLFLKDSLEFIV
ncbi:hypothetical protein EYF80_056479 [Liparis tanakae]|uniref:Uncharacterized protein n=1 Tax=Liparis tanakae TaxID=230148 RepID=A0A4Z2EXR4_9TELE|nr:hypothetical protein EYF80_056479 [Liparis tanakae]